MYVDAISDQIDMEDFVDSAKRVCWNGHKIKDLSEIDPRVNFPKSLNQSSKYSLRGKAIEPMMVKASISYENDGFKAEISAEHDFSTKESSEKESSPPQNEPSNNESSNADPSPEIAENSNN